MPFATGVTFGAGTVLAFEDPDTPDSYVGLPNVVDIGEVGEVSDANDVSALVDETDIYSAGPEAGAGLEYSFNHIPSLVDYQAFMGLVDAKETVKMRVTYKTGDVATVPVLMLGKKMAAAQRKEKNTMKVYAKQSGKSVWTEAS